MSEQGEHDERGEDDAARQAARKRRMAEIFGEVLPETTGDERDSDSADAQDAERWYRQNRPPHYE